MIGEPQWGFLGLLSGEHDFEPVFRRVGSHLLTAYGLTFDLDIAKLSKTLEVWRVFSLKLVRAEYSGTPDDGQFKAVSGLKMAGSCLWSLVQEECAPIQNIRENATGVFGGAAGTHSNELRKLFLEFPREMFAFHVVYNLYNAEQRGRIAAGQATARGNFDFTKPISDPHYCENLCKMLHTQTTPFNVYMIFKTMDLFSIIKIN